MICCQGLDTPTPFLKLGTRIYEGRYEYTVGTHLFFEEGEDTCHALNYSWSAI